MKLVKSRFRDRYWIEDEKGKRVTDKFYEDNIKIYGPITYICILESVAITSDGLLISPFKVTNIKDKYYSVCGSVNGNVKRLTYNQDGKLIFNDTCLYSYEDGLIVAQKGRFFGFMDENLSWVIKPQFLGVKQTFINGKAVVEIEDRKCVVINKKGEYVGEPFECNYTICFKGKEPTFLIQTKNGRGVVDLQGRIIIPPIYYDINRVGDYYKLIQQKTYGLTDEKGNVLLECKYPKFVECEDKFVVKEYSLEGFYDKEILK